MWTYNTINSSNKQRARKTSTIVKLIYHNPPISNLLCLCFLNWVELIILFWSSSILIMENEEVPSASSTPATPGTPGAPLFNAFRQDKGGNAGRKSLLRSCSTCFSLEDWALEEGTVMQKVSCSLSPPPGSLARRVYHFTYKRKT